MSDYQPMTCLPVLALRGLVVFPGCVTHFDVGRTKSVRSVEEAMRANQTIFLVAQRDLETDDPKKADLYEIGTVATVKQILRLPGDNMRILVEGQYRAKLLDMIHSEPYLFDRATCSRRAATSRRPDAPFSLPKAAASSAISSPSRPSFPSH